MLTRRPRSDSLAVASCRVVPCSAFGCLSFIVDPPLTFPFLCPHEGTRPPSPPARAKGGAKRPMGEFGWAIIPGDKLSHASQLFPIVETVDPPLPSLSALSPLFAPPQTHHSSLSFSRLVPVSAPGSTTAAPQSYESSRTDGILPDAMVSMRRVPGDHPSFTLPLFGEQWARRGPSKGLIMFIQLNRETIEQRLDDHLQNNTRSRRRVRPALSPRPRSTAPQPAGEGIVSVSRQDSEYNKVSSSGEELRLPKSVVR